MSIYDRMKAHCIVQTSLDMACSVRCCPVEITDTDGDRLSAALEIRTNRCGQDPELVFISRLYTDNRVAAKHIGTDI